MAKLALNLVGVEKHGVLVIPAQHPALEDLHIKPEDPKLEAVVKGSIAERKEMSDTAKARIALDETLATAFDKAVEMTSGPVDRVQQKDVEAEFKERQRAKIIAKGMPCDSDWGRFHRLRKLAIKKAKERGAVLPENAQGWVLCVHAVDGRTYRFGKPTHFVESGEQRMAVRPIEVGDSKFPVVLGHVVVSPVGTVMGAKVYDSSKRVLCCIGEAEMKTTDRWSPFSEGFNRVARIRKELMKL